jgi:hypothetical protein
MITRHAYQCQRPAPSVTPEPSRVVLRLLGPSLLVMASGCHSPDPSGKYDDFNHQTLDDREEPEAPLDMGPVVSDLGGEGCPDIDGVFLVALETRIAPGLPLQFIAEVDAEIAMTGDGTVAIELVPLSLDPGSTTLPREEVGESLEIGASVTGCSFLMEFGETMVTGEANPITGSDILADLSLDAMILTEDAWCGDVMGMVLSPLMASLKDSTFAAVRLADRRERPVEFPVTCAGAG